MNFFVYILYSSKLDKFYIGHTNNLDRRIYEHNLGRENFTRKGVPWQVKFFRIYETKTEAAAEERRLKKCKSRKYLENYIVTQQKSSLVEHPDW